MGEQELVFLAAEIYIIEITCGKCGTGIVFNAAETGPIPDACPACRHQMPGLEKTLSVYRQWYTAINQSSDLFRFRVRTKK